MLLQANNCSFDCNLSFANKMLKIFFSRKTYRLLFKKKKRKCLKQKITINFIISKRVSKLIYGWNCWDYLELSTLKYLKETKNEYKLLTEIDKTLNQRR